MELTQDDIGVRVMQWISVRCPIQKPRKEPAKQKRRPFYPTEREGHRLVLSVMTDTPRTSAEVAVLINRSRNRVETVMKDLVTNKEVRVVSGRPNRFARKR